MIIENCLAQFPALLTIAMNYFLRSIRNQIVNAEYDFG